MTDSLVGAFSAPPNIMARRSRSLVWTSTIRSQASVCVLSNRSPFASEDVEPIEAEKETNGIKPLSFTHRPPGETPRPTVKRKVALFISYFGGDFFGMQFHNNGRTVEGSLLAALCAAGYLRESNTSQLLKSHLSRSARTDRGVSAACNVVSMRCEFDRTKEPDVEEAVQKVSACLPDDIELQGMVRVRKNFTARRGVDSRTYEYLIPASALGITEDTAEASANELQQIFAPFVGQHHDYINFTNPKKLSETTTTKRKVLSITCRPLQEGGRLFMVVELRGESFIYHQIRKMVSAAIMVKMQLVPRHFVELALDATIGCHILEMPGEFLLLKSIGAEVTAVWMNDDRTKETREGIDQACERAATFTSRIYKQMATYLDKNESMVEMWFVHLASVYNSKTSFFHVQEEHKARWQPLLEKRSEILEKIRTEKIQEQIERGQPLREYRQVQREAMNDSDKLLKMCGKED
eukprot:Plantae.Rhodophyta-Purpureofilum_apyrenoidigerum.ctg1190.p1 GENE.Plantae.Rhodophyta-Purpureofilum_apyrenoidigerum.ctg1190~~Plantae.Rhodophyta-Purpureofilum_apyrenoidigerum.ctg1190.p1  ORF type:complete len:466 (-),score=70.06 Plantae.Rhodophyta-Purpureofilum_apyrenoidigerum.ctg1190:777-2174(-)